MNRGINEWWSCGGNSPLWMELDGKLRGEGWGGDTWCRGCCQSPDSRAFVFSIITRSTSFLPHSFLPERTILPSLFQFFPEVISIVNQWINSGRLISLIDPCDKPKLTYLTLLSYFLTQGWNNDEIFTQTGASVPTVCPVVQSSCSMHILNATFLKSAAEFVHRSDEMTSLCKNEQNHCEKQVWGWDFLYPVTSFSWFHSRKCNAL